MDARGGIDLGGTKIQAVVVDGRHAVLGEDRRPTPQTGGPADVAAAIAAAQSAAAAAAGVDTASLIGVGVGSPGEIDAATGAVAQARNLPDWEGSFPLGPELERLLGAPVRLGNDVSVATEAEAELGAGRDFGSLLGVFWGTGVGGGIVLDGRLWVGRGIAGELGHVVVRQGGRHCPCGRRGCLEAYAGRGAMEARARKLAGEGRDTKLFQLMEKHGRDRLTSGIWARALERDDELAHELVGEAVEALGTGVASAVNLLDVEAVIVGGGLGLRLGEPYREHIEAAMLPHLFNDAEPPAVRLAALGDLGGAIGAALLVAPGRPARRRRAPEVVAAGGAGAVVGVDVGGTKVAAGIVDGAELRDRVERPTDLSSADALLDEIAAVARDAGGGELAAVGVGIPSQIDAASGTALASVNVPLSGVPVRDALGKRLGVPVFIDNDANCAALAEAHLVPDPPAHELVMLTLGTGVGGGIVIDGRIFRGATGLAAELGHIVIDGRAAADEPAAMDDLPRPGSLEWHCSGRGLAREATRCAQRNPDGALGRLYAEHGRVSGRDAVAAARAGDSQALALMERYGRWLGIGVATVVNAFEPKRVVIGGGLSGAAELFLDVAVAEAARWALPALWERTTVGLARGGADAGAIGAALLAAHELERSGHTAR
jgi:glucokinase